MIINEGLSERSYEGLSERSYEGSETLRAINCISTKLHQK